MNVGPIVAELDDLDDLYDVAEIVYSDGVCTLPEGVPCLLLFNAEMDCGDCGFYDGHMEAVKWE